MAVLAVRGAPAAAVAALTPRASPITDALHAAPSVCDVDDHLTTILAEKRGKSRKVLEIRNAEKPRWL
jgi:hypothetical protein